MNVSYVNTQPGSHATTMPHSPLSWVHEDPTYAIQIQMEVDGNNAVTDILGVGPALAYHLESKYTIHTINDLVGYIMYNGFPQDLHFNEETKFILSLKCANKMMKWV